MRRLMRSTMGETTHDRVDESAETPRLVPVMSGNACAGFFVGRGPLGAEAFDADEKSLGIFPDLRSAATAVENVEPAHSKFGGSTATRVLACPASAGFTAKVPDYLRRTSAYAKRGTACHAAMIHLIDENQDLE